MSFPINVEHYYSAKNDATSPFSLIRDIMADIQLELASTEPQTVALLASALSAEVHLVRPAVYVMQHRLEVIKDHLHQWWRGSTFRNSLDALGPKEQAVYTYVNANPGDTLSGIASGTGHNQSLTAVILRTLLEQQDVFTEVDHAAVRRFASRETAITQMSNTNLAAAWTDIQANEGTTLAELAGRLYPSMAEGKRTAITRRLLRCLLHAKGVLMLA
jgi:hypothetical protein